LDLNRSRRKNTIEVYTRLEEKIKSLKGKLDTREEERGKFDATKEQPYNEAK
jgi:hypothetical protein